MLYFVTDLMTVRKSSGKTTRGGRAAIYDSQKAAALVTTRMTERRERKKTSFYLDVKFLECKNLKRIHHVLFTLRSLQLKMPPRELARLDCTFTTEAAVLYTSCVIISKY